MESESVPQPLGPEVPQPQWTNPVEALTRIRGVHLGVDIGGKSDYTALVMVEVGERPTAATYVDYRDHKLHPVPEAVYRVQELRRLPLGLSFGAMAAAVVALVGAVHDFERELRSQGAPLRSFESPLAVDIFLDSTGLGAPVVELVHNALLASSKTDRALLHPITFTYGDRFDREKGSLGKAYLVSRLQVLLEHGRLSLPADDPTTALMAEELMDYEVHIEPDANEKYGAFRVGTHDDLVTALGLACIEEPGYYTVQAGPRIFG
jgi:hypothetical protein